jgi:hypothetical protein
MPEPSIYEVEVAVGKLKRYKSPGADQFPAELIHAGRETLHSEIHKLLSSLGTKKIFPPVEGMNSRTYSQKG